MSSESPNQKDISKYFQYWFSLIMLLGIIDLPVFICKGSTKNFYKQLIF